MNSGINIVRAITGLSALSLSLAGLEASPAVDQELAQQILDTMLQVHGVQPGFRPVHAKGVVCEGTFTASKEAAALSRAAHFQGDTVPVTVRFSDGAPDPHVPDFSPEAGPRGLAIRFLLPGGEKTDIVAMSHNGFVVATPAEFLALQKAVVATDPSKPHPWPVEDFLGSHPLALKFVQEIGARPASFGTAAFFSNDSFVFVNKEGKKQVGRYKFLPVAGAQDLTEAEAKGKTPDYLTDELKERLAKGPVQFRLVIQIPNPGDVTNDPSIVWPDDRKTIEVGTTSVNSMVAESDAASQKLAFAPTPLPDGIELSDDPFPALRSAVYTLSVKHRQAAEGKK
ncbi:MAG: catalase family peroxidase [Chthoniobacterales bacterium]